MSQAAKQGRKQELRAFRTFVDGGLIRGSQIHPPMPDPYSHLALSLRLQLLAFEAELAHLPRSLISAVWEAFDTVSAMTWKPSDDMDREVRSWMKAKGWEVTRTNYDSERQVYAWLTMYGAVHHRPCGSSARFSRVTLHLWSCITLMSSRWLRRFEPGPKPAWWSCRAEAR